MMPSYNTQPVLYYIPVTDLRSNSTNNNSNNIQQNFIQPLQQVNRTMSQTNNYSNIPQHFQQQQQPIYYTNTQQPVVATANSLQRKNVLPSFRNLLSNMNYPLDSQPVPRNNSHTYTYNNNRIRSITPPQTAPNHNNNSTNTITAGNNIKFDIPQYINNPPLQNIHHHRQQVPQNVSAIPSHNSHQQISYFNNTNNINSNNNNSLHPNVTATVPRSLPYYSNTSPQNSNVIISPHPTHHTHIPSPPQSNVPLLQQRKKSNKIVKKRSRTTPSDPTKPPRRRKRYVKKDSSSIHNMINSSYPLKKCYQCQESSTPEWRLGPYGNRSLCNACGLYYRRLIQRFDLKQANLIMRFNKFVKPNNNMRHVPNQIDIPHNIIKQLDMDPQLDSNYNNIE